MQITREANEWIIRAHECTIRYGAHVREMCSECNKGFARRGTHLYPHDSVPQVYGKQKQQQQQQTLFLLIYFDLLHVRIWN